MSTHFKSLKNLRCLKVKIKKSYIYIYYKNVFNYEIMTKKLNLKKKKKKKKYI